MNIKNEKNSEMNDEKDSNIFNRSMNEKNLLIKEEDFNCFIYEDNYRCLNEDIYMKEKEEVNDSLSLDKHKNSNDLNLTSKDLHEFLNDDLIKAIDNDLVEPKDICDLSDCNSSCECIEGSSECTSKANSPEFNIKYPKIIKDINMNLNVDNSFDKKDSNNINNNCFVNKDYINNSIKNINNNDEIVKGKIIEEEKSIVIDIKDKSKELKSSIFSSKFIPKKKSNNIENIKSKEEKEKNSQNFKVKEKNNRASLKNKFDDEVEPTLMLPLTNWEEKTKLPLEIRVGDWICLYCNNLNFSFRKKCNRCGLFRKSSTLLLKHQYFNNKYQNMENFNNNNDGYYINCNQNNNYDLNYI